MEILPDDLKHTAVQALLASHLDAMRETAPPENTHALDVSGLQADNITFWVAWDEGEVLGCGALKELSPTWGEIKSMRTHADHLRKGVAAKMLEHIINTARERAYTKLSLETGTDATFQAAIRLYRKYGFTEGAVFAGYPESAFNTFMHLDLRE